MKFVLFDIDGTLTDTKDVDDRCFMKAFEHTFGVNIWTQQWEDINDVTDWGITEEIILRELNRKPNDDEYEMMITNFIDSLTAERSRDESQFTEIPGAKDFFDQLREIDEFKLGIATGSWEKSAKLKLESAKININDICFSHSNHHKSRESITKDVIEQLTRKHRESPDQIIYFGDGEWDYKTCKKLGINFIGIDSTQDCKLRKLGAATVFQDFTDTEQILFELKI